MSKKIITAALLAGAAFATGAYAQSYDQGGYGARSAPQQQYDSTSSQTQYYNYQGEPTTSPSYSQEQGQNGQYVDHSNSEMRGRPNNYARDMKDGPMGTSPGS
ncbi:hypothetical protein J8I26_06260 [Herbaspirillum sp. LeCh32-8]|uniref:hypothetical protein n=1 Tax=Herbaspirillum sp. LeCh32-8 TaxID=2821356 RepID=UPI001AEB246F|nr:hypothetical protein [Herbaspirillum sp. LeCh32-8]MBP0597697.1 hypothetical protein [Herbaspirillum sp. LeCh32-8]